MSDTLTDFDLIWQQYPRKTAKQVARKAWAKLQPDAPTVQAMIDALRWQVLLPQWQRGIIPPTRINSWALIHSFG